MQLIPKNTCILFLAFSFFLESCLFSKTSIKHETNSYFANDNKLDSIAKKSKHLICLSITNSRKYGASNLFILSLQKKQWYKIAYFNPDNIFNGIPYKVETKKIKKSLSDSIFLIFKSSKFNEINTDSLNSCSSKNTFQCYRSDVNTYELVIMRNGKIFSKKGYDIFFVNECCPGVLDRQRFIACHEALKKIN